MKNSLVKYLEHEAKEAQPDLKMWTQNCFVPKQNPELTSEEDWEVYTPDINYEDPSESYLNNSSKDNLNLLMLFDDTTYMAFMIKTLR